MRGITPTARAARTGIVATSMEMPVARRAAVLGVCCLGAIRLCGTASADAASDERMRRPKPGDRLVLAQGDGAGAPIGPDALADGGPQVLAWPADAQTGILRDGSRLNQVLLVRPISDGMNEVTRARSAAGIVAYSAICPHALCPVTEWIKDRRILHCPCHNSEYDPQRAAMVVNGPALRALAALPLRLEGGVLLVAEPFIGKVGAQQT